MRCADRPSTDHERPCVVADFFQVSENPVSASSTQSRDVLNEAPRRAYSGDDPRQFLPETGACSSDPGTLPGGADVLAGESAGDEIDSSPKRLGVEGSHVVEDGDSRPVFGEDGSAEGIDFAEGDGADPDSFAREGESSDAGEQVEGRKSFISHTLSRRTQAVRFRLQRTQAHGMIPRMEDTMPTQIEKQIEGLGFTREDTGGGCEAGIRPLTDGFYILITDGEAGFPTDEDRELYVGVFHEEHGDTLFERVDVAPENLDAAVDELKTAWFLFECPCGSTKPFAPAAGRVFCRDCYAIDQEIGAKR